MLQLVEIDGDRFISDTGFGKMTPTAPLRLVPDIDQHTPHGRYRLADLGDTWRLEAQVDGEWQHLYVFDPRPAYPGDFEMSNWYVSTHPASHFTRDLIAVRTVANGRHVLHNARYSFYGVDETAMREEFSSVGPLLHLLENTFGLDVASVPGLEAKLRRIIEASLIP
jgi:N-hydroxyarylamine O-acetyltransferase